MLAVFCVDLVCSTQSPFGAAKTNNNRRSNMDSSQIPFCIRGTLLKDSMKNRNLFS